MKSKLSNLLFIVFSFVAINSINAQNHKYYIRAINQNFDPELYNDGSSLKYKGTDNVLKELFETNNIYVFEKAFPDSQQSHLLRTFYVETDSDDSIDSFVVNASSYFDHGVYIGFGPPELAFYPDDYGITGGANLGAPADLSYLDFIGMPKAWNITTGSSETPIGVADGKLYDDYIYDDDFKNKVTLINDATVNEFHGTNVSAIVAAQGNNGFAATGVCYDCSIIKTTYSFNAIKDLVSAGAKVINCSWGGVTFVQEQQDYINEVVESKNVIIVAASHNDRWNEYPGTRFRYPASYDNVISVGAVGSKNELQCSEIINNQIVNVKNYIGGTVKLISGYDCNLPLENQVYIDPGTTATLNDKVDILGPGGAIFRHFPYVQDNILDYTPSNVLFTSPSTPLVSGTVGLMKNLNECITFKEVESILKITSTNIDDIPANQFASGNYGSGSLNAGRAVQLMDALMKGDSIAYLQNQKFSRWNFIFNGVSKNIVIQNQKFTEGSTLTVHAKNVITIEDGTLLEPNENGFTILEIDPNLIIPEDCSSFIGKGNTTQEKKKFNEVIYKVYPTIVDKEMNVENTYSNDAIIKSIKIYDILGRMVMEKDNINTPKILLDIPDLEKGVYILKGYNEFNEGVLTEKFIKK